MKRREWDKARGQNAHPIGEGQEDITMRTVVGSTQAHCSAQWGTVAPILDRPLNYPVFQISGFPFFSQFP